MIAQVIDGRAAAARLIESVRARAQRFDDEFGRRPGLAVVLVGDDPASSVYVRAKTERARACGIASFFHRLRSTTSESELLSLIAQLNRDPAVDGILVQLPLPPQIAADHVLRQILPSKDVDGFHPLNAGLLAIGQPGLVPCTPLGCLRLVQSIVPDLVGQNVVVVGRSTIVGRPAAQVFLNADCSVTILHKESRDVAGHCRNADILVVAAGSPGLVRRDWVKPGAVVIDVGINRVRHRDGYRLVGDVDFDAVQYVASAITPVPGGVGPMTVATLMENTLTCAESLAVQGPELMSPDNRLHFDHADA